ncbi:peptidylprolyl isomerase [Treponema brennaborense]|uniref:Basic membrane protein n=1 Tax=Treponema brennaborense (strain DSM 12168 / CIP 105900 / DD5/3) TaxID=906968 RepID=F4LIQ1_TREBD|nr:peptidylprolyl isomerase [Treponema brennaborense]AEE16226.1 basic membrane protein [Treponema brennaborense DSM 12168]
MKRLVVSFIVCICGAAAVFAQADLQPLANVKLYQPESITLKQLKNRVESYKLQSGVASFTVDQKKEILNGMIDEKLVVQAAMKNGINITDAQINDYFLSYMSQQIGQTVTEVQLAKLVKEQTGMSLDDYIKGQVGMGLAEYKSYLKNQLIAQQYILSLKQSEVQKIAPTDEEIRAFYEMSKSSFVQSDVLKLFLVVVPKNDDEKAARKKITGMFDDVKSKKLTADKIKALQQSDSSFQAGDLYVSKTAQAAQQLGINYQGLLELFTKDTGFISDLNETDTDFQFYIVRNKYDAKMLTLSDVVQPDSTVTVYEYIRQNLTAQKQSQFLVAAVQEVTESLRVPENYQMLKTGSALDSLLQNW